MEQYRKDKEAYLKTLSPKDMLDIKAQDLEKRKKLATRRKKYVSIKPPEMFSFSQDQHGLSGKLEVLMLTAAVCNG